MRKIARAGNTGPKARSDCYVQMELLDSGGIQFNLKSKVANLYKESITSLIYTVLAFFSIEHARIEIADKGALPWVIMARLESAIKQLVNTEKEFLPDFIENNKYKFEKECDRLSRLYLPGNTPSIFINAGIHKPNAIIIDLEETILMSKKDEARILVRNALRACDFYGVERMVRINQGSIGIEDLKYIVPHNIHTILLAKVESSSHILAIEKEIAKLKKENNIKESIYLIPTIESALGVENAFEIATASDNIVALAINIDNYILDIGISGSSVGEETIYARSRLVNAARAAKIQALDSILSSNKDADTLIKNIKASKRFGFEGVGCNHPKQVDIINKGFAPNADELEKAKLIVYASNKAEQKGSEITRLNSRTLEKHIVKYYRQQIGLALKYGLLENNWEGKMDS